MAPEPVIRSRQNPIYKQVRLLLRRDMRHREQAFLVEGPRFVADAERFGATPRLLVLSESHAASVGAAPVPDYPIRIFDDVLFASLSDTATSQGMIGVFPFPRPAPRPASAPLVLVAAGIQDPGNLGTLIRSAAAAGATKVITLPGTVDPWSTKTVRAAAAAHFAIPIESRSIESMRTALPPEITVVGTAADAVTSYDQHDLTLPLAVIIGAEGQGISESIRALVDEFISIPLMNEIESLNAAVAGSIILFEARRQRSLLAQSDRILSR